MIYNCRICGNDADWDEGHGCALGTPENERHRLTLKERDVARADLAAAQCTIEQLGKDAAALAADNERLKGELAEARGFVRRVASVCGQVRQPSPQEFEALRIVARWDAPPPAESTLVCDCRPEHQHCEECRPDLHAAPPDDIRARLERHGQANAEWEWKIERRLAALEAKGEPGTHADAIARRGSEGT